MNTYKNTIQNSGGTFTKDGIPANLTDGYMVGVTGLVSGMDEVSFNILFERVASYENIHPEHDAYVGTWVHENQIYIDLSLHILNLDDAMAIGEINSQLAIYDLKNNVSIPLK